MLGSVIKIFLCSLVVAALAISAALLPARTKNSGHKETSLMIEYWPAQKKVELERTKTIEDFDFPLPQPKLAKEVESIIRQSQSSEGEPAEVVTPVAKEIIAEQEDSETPTETEIRPTIVSALEEEEIIATQELPQENLTLTIYDDTTTRLEALNNVFGKIAVRVDLIDFDKLKAANATDQTELLSELFSRSPLSGSAGQAKIIEFHTASTDNKVKILQEIFGSFETKIATNEATYFVENYPQAKAI